MRGCKGPSLPGREILAPPVAKCSDENGVGEPLLHPNGRLSLQSNGRAHAAI